MSSFSLAAAAVSLINHLGYAGLGIGLLLNAMGILIPSEVLIPLAGVAVRQGRFSPVVLVVVAVFGQTVGALIAREIGERGGVPLVKRFGHFVLLSHKDLEAAQRLFESYGKRVSIVGFCLPLIRGYIGYVAGIAKMNAAGVAVSAIVGSLIWTLALLGLGYLLADNLGTIEAIIRPFSYIIVVLLIVLAAWFVRRRLQERV